ncbi:MAG: insulinase family protein [Prevotellaceae bacterium]|jgi:predicted Zn-dependent peptidase|nr:insulinase family protein [Prevotellaceae bacterium]
MIDYKRYTLNNGLTLVVHRDTSSPIAAVNMLYKVGSKNESPEKTGFAHLFEHLMFSGSVNAPDFDKAIQMASGENNAFTGSDYTNYYITLPKENIETALWLESDRLLSPNITEHNIEVQKSVVVEEFNQRYLNQPYGDIWLLLRPLAYKVHPYSWSTIGKKVEHIQNATAEDVQAFFNTHYTPSNAILSIVADMDEDEMYQLVEKWFADIPNRKAEQNAIPQEPKQLEAREQAVYRNVPSDAIYKAYKMCNRVDADYYTCDMISDILSNGRSARMYRRLVQEKQLFSNISAYLTGELDEGLFVIAGRLLPAISIDIAEQAIEEEFRQLIDKPVTDYELEKVKNKVEAAQIFADTSVLNKAMTLAYYEMLGDLSLANREIELYRKISKDDIGRVGANIFNPKRCSTLYYLSNSKT